MMKDRFAEIAVQAGNLGGNLLIQPEPPKLPERFLPVKKNNPKAAFRPRPKLDSVKKLQRELVKQQRKIARFMQDLAPKFESMRKTVMLKEFHWRKETDADLKNFTGHTLAGKGTWEKIRIPHFGPPTGRAVTYYRKSFKLSRTMLKKYSVFICFKGVDYKAHVFINGSFIGSHEGFFAPFEFEFTSVARAGENTLLVKVENDAICMGNPPVDGEVFQGNKLYAATGCGWDDPESGWHHFPPGMGIYQDVYIETRSDVHIHDIFVRPLPDRNRAEAWVEIYNCGTVSKKISLKLSVFGQNFRKTVFRDKEYIPCTRHIPGVGDMAKPGDGNFMDLLIGPGLNYLEVPFQFPDARLWQPDSPWLYQIQVKLIDEKGSLCDIRKRQFGMRSFRMDVDNEPKGRFFLNGRQVKLRGANATGHIQQCVIKGDFNQLRDDILLGKICNINFFRLTQRPVNPEVYEYCDRLGMMTQTDLPLFGCLRRNQFCEAVKQAEEMERLIRSHPCNIVISYINEPFPNGWSKPHRNLDSKQLEDFFAAADKVVSTANPDRVIKPVDGDYDPPSPGLPDNHCYCGWYLGHGIDLGKLHKGFWQPVKPGWLYGCGEFGAEGLDTEELMRKYYPAKWLPANNSQEKNWSPDRIIAAQTGRFHYMWFDTQSNLKDWSNMSQLHQAWIVRMMTEAFRRDNRMNTFAVHEFIDAFPSCWLKAIVDFDRKPKKAYYAYREALAPILVNLRTDRYHFFSGEQMNLEAWICNDLNEEIKNITLHYQLEMADRIVFAGRTKASVPICSSQFQGYLRLKAPRVNKRAEAVVRLAMIDKHNKVLSDTAIDIDIFPRMTATHDKKVLIVGSRKGKAAQLARNLGFKTRFLGNAAPNEVVLIDDFAIFQQRYNEIIRAVKNGAIAVLLELPQGQFQIAGQKVAVEACGARHFVSRNTGHKLVRGFKPADFRFWFDTEVGYVTPLLHTTFTATGFDAILTSGNGDSFGKWQPTLAAAEKKVGKGFIRICQIELANRTLDNPIAKLFAIRLLGLSFNQKKNRVLCF